MEVEKQRRVATVAELRARTLAAEARAALLAQQLRAAVDVVAALELQSATPQPNLRGDARRLLDSALRLPTAQEQRLCQDLAEKEAEVTALRRELAGCAAGEAAVRERMDVGCRRAAELLRASLSNASRARERLAEHQDAAAQAAAAQATALQDAQDRLVACEQARGKAESDAKASRESCSRLMALVEQHERRHRTDLERFENFDVERLQMQRALSQMADELDCLKSDRKPLRKARLNSKPPHQI